MLYLLTFLIAALLAWAFNALELVPWRRAAGAHWTVQARKLHPARISRAQTLWVLPVGLTLATRIFYPDSTWGLVGAAGLLGSLLGNYPMDRATNPGLNFSNWTHEVAGGLILKFSGWGNFVVAAALMPDHFGPAALGITAVFFTGFFALQFGGALRLMRALRILQPASRRLQALVDATSSAMGVPVRATWELTGSAANAFAFVTTRELGFSRKLVGECGDDELRGICAHELGHLTESRWTLVGRLVGALTLFPLIYVRPAFAQGREVGIAVLVLLVVGVWFAHLRLAQAMEKRADRVARDNVENAASYARGLERLYRINLFPAVLQKNSSHHPSLYDRMLAAGLTPDYPRPTAPSNHGWTGTLVTIGTTFMAMYHFI